MKTVSIYTDGACSGNPGPGGWAAILEYAGFEKEISGFERDTTNNRMELLAAIGGLSALKEPCEVALYSDSSYLVDGFTKRWVYSWKRNGWQKSNGDPALNSDLWKRLLELCDIHKIRWIKVKGHADDEKYERCDALARAEILKHRQTATSNYS